MINDDISGLRLMGIWDHFYQNSTFDKDVATHYVNLPHYIHCGKEPEIEIDCQHDIVNWYSLKLFKESKNFYTYIKIYASWLSKRLYEI
jgi:colanic acid biosynthesis protein WcaH